LIRKIQLGGTYLTKVTFLRRRGEWVSETKDISDIIKTAMQLEVDGREYYEEMARKVVNPLGKAMFTQLAKDEIEHLETLRRRHEKLFPGKEIARVTPTREGWEKSPIKIFRQREIKERTSELEALKVGIENEVRAKEFYEKAAKESSDEERDLFLGLAEFEKGHEALLRAEQDILSKSGYWFDFREFSLEVE